MSIDFGKFKKNSEVEQEIGEEKVADIASDKLELSDNLEKSDNILEKVADKSENSPKYNITSDQLRAIYVMITGKTNRNYTKKTLSNKIIEILTNGN